jgi:transposase
MDKICKMNHQGQPVLLMFQDEARFGRVSMPVSCWAPHPFRPVVKYSLVREFKYIYGSVAPWDGFLHYQIYDKMNTENMVRYLKALSKKFNDYFIVLVLDGASSHTTKNLIKPDNISLISLPPYSPDLNPVEQLWRILRKNRLHNKLFETLDDVMHEVKLGLNQIARNKNALCILTNWEWIDSLKIKYR